MMTGTVVGSFPVISFLVISAISQEVKNSSELIEI
jgi:hypothetical protein